MVLLVWQQVQQVHHLVGLHRPLLEEDEESARPADFQIVGQQPCDGFVDERLGVDVTGEASLQGVGAELHAELDSGFTHLTDRKMSSELHRTLRTKLWRSYSRSAARL